MEKGAVLPVNGIDIYEKIRKIFAQNGGVVKTSQILANGIHNRHLDELVAMEKCIRIKRGYYQWIFDGEADEITIVSKLFPEAILCMESALHHYGYIDRTPNCWHIAVDRNCKKSKYKLHYPPLKVYYVDAKYLNIGLITADINQVKISMYDRERVICDVIRHANKLEKEMVNQAIQEYVKDPQKQIVKLVEYAKAMRAYTKMKVWLGVWL